MDNRAYYLAAGKSLAAVKTWLAANDVIRKKRIAFAKRFGTKNYLYLTRGDQSTCFVGLVFSRKVPEGWKKHKDYECYVPNKRTKAGKSLIAEIQQLGTESAPGYKYLEASTLHWAQCTKIGKQFIISQHPKAKPPIDAKLLKTAEFYAMYEASKSKA